MSAYTADVSFALADSLALAGVVVARSLVKKQKLPHVYETVVISGGEFAYDMIARQKLEAFLAAYTGEKMWSAYLANILGLSGVLYLLSVFGIQKGEIDPEKGDGKKSKDSAKHIMKALMLSTELVIEKGVIEYAFGLTSMIQAKTGGSVAGTPVAAVTR